MLTDVAKILSFSGNQVADMTGGADPRVTPAIPLRMAPTWAKQKKPLPPYGLRRRRQAPAATRADRSNVVRRKPRVSR